MNPDEKSNSMSHPTLARFLALISNLPKFIIRIPKRLRSLVKLTVVTVTPRLKSKEIMVSYGHWSMPANSNITSGGMVKFTQLNRAFPHSFRSFNILYLGSSSLPADWLLLARAAKNKGAKIVWNQNGVGYPAWAGQNWQDINKPMREILHAADYVFYQSKFCKLSADLFLGERRGDWEILYNPVDTDRFLPVCPDLGPTPIILLHAGTVLRRYRLETALRTVAELIRMGVDVRLLFAGALAWNKDKGLVNREVEWMLDELGVRNIVTLRPPYSRDTAPLIFQSAHMLLHTKLNDPCPTVVLEALASGLPVVHSESGGVPELVGEAGIGVPSLTNWDEEAPPKPKDLAQAVIKIAADRGRYSQAARQRAVDYFSLQNWVQRHRIVFGHLVR